MFLRDMLMVGGLVLGLILGPVIIMAIGPEKVRLLWDSLPPTAQNFFTVFAALFFLWRVVRTVKGIEK